MNWKPVAPSPARSILPIDLHEGDRVACWFGPLDPNELMALDALRWFAVREGAAFYCHRDSQDITTALVRMPSADWSASQADGEE